MKIKKTADVLETVIIAYERELHNELPTRLAEVENILHRLEQRGLRLLRQHHAPDQHSRTWSAVTRFEPSLKSKVSSRRSPANRRSGPTPDRLVGAERPARMATGDELPATPSGAEPGSPGR